MRNEWIAIQVKCVSPGNCAADGHNDTPNRCWDCCDKIRALCFIIRDAFGDFWSLKFISNGRFVIGSCCNKLLRVATLRAQIKNHFKNLEKACAAFLVEHDGSFKPAAEALTWKIRRASSWTGGATGWGLQIVNEMKSLGFDKGKPLELILLGAHQTLLFRFFCVGMKMAVMAKMTDDPFKTHIDLPEDALGSLTSGPKPRADPPGISVKKCCYPEDCRVKQAVIKHILSLLVLVSECADEEFGHAFL